MENLKNIADNFKLKSDKRFDAFEIESSIGSLSKIQEEAYLEKSKWIGGDEKFICLAIDLDKSSVLSARKKSVTMAKLYEYFTQNAVDVLSMEEIRADYIDIKGDGVFGIYQNPNAIEKALIAGITFRTLFEKVIKPKFKNDLNIDLNCKSAICKDKILVKKIGTRKYNNEVWAGRLVNNTHKIMGISDKIKNENQQLLNNSLLIISNEIYTYLHDNFKQYAVMSCGCNAIDRKPTKLWSVFNVELDDNIYGDSVHYLSSIWCDTHGDEYLSKILKKN